MRNGIVCRQLQSNDAERFQSLRLEAFRLEPRALRSEHRRQGVADAIMARLVEEARRRVERVTLSVVSENRRALRFYERWGFRAYGLEPSAAKIETDDYLDEVLMALVLKNER